MENSDIVLNHNNDSNNVSLSDSDFIPEKLFDTNGVRITSDIFDLKEQLQHLKDTEERKTKIYSDMTDIPIKWETFKVVVWCKKNYHEETNLDIFQSNLSSYVSEGFEDDNTETTISDLVMKKRQFECFHEKIKR